MNNIFTPIYDVCTDGSRARYGGISAYFTGIPYSVGVSWNSIVMVCFCLRSLPFPTISYKIFIKDFLFDVLDLAISLPAQVFLSLLFRVKIKFYIQIRKAFPNQHGWVALLV